MQSQCQKSSFDDKKSPHAKSGGQRNGVKVQIQVWLLNVTARCEIHVVRNTQGGEVQRRVSRDWKTSAHEGTKPIS